MISVIIPLYNKESIIEKSLRSVLSQDYDDFEVVIVNDGSTDRSAEIVKDINDSRIRLINQENGGPSKARNTGVNNSKGEWIVFLDADDELLPGSLCHYYSLVLSHPQISFFACPFWVFDGKSRKLCYRYEDRIILNPFKESFKGNLLPRTGAFICKKELLIANPFHENIRRFEDLELLYRLYHSANIYVSSEPVMVVNQEYAAASNGRRDIKEDFLGYLNFMAKSFWEKMCLYQFYLGERPLYVGQVDSLYPTLRYRYDLLLLSKLLKK